jgi:hypothetical protein
MAGDEPVEEMLQEALAKRRQCSQLMEAAFAGALADSDLATA